MSTTTALGAQSDRCNVWPRPDGLVATATTAPLWLVSTLPPGGVVVRLDGRLDPNAAARLSHILTDLIVGQGFRAVVLDLRNVGSVDEAVPAVLAAAAAAVEKEGGELMFTGPRATIVGALTTAGLARLIGPTPSALGQRPSILGESRHPAGSNLRRPNPREIT